MKTRILLLSIGFAAMMTACTDKISEQFQWDEGVMATLPEFEEAGTGTRVSFMGGLDSFAWTYGDCIGVCRSSASTNGTAAFTLLKGGERVGNFINDSFSLLPQTDYYAFYPFVAGTTVSSFPMNVAKQTQIGNKDLSHIGDLNYMSAKFTTDENGKASFTFSNICAIIQVHFTADREDTYKNLTITSNGAPFTIRAHYDLSTETITPDYTHNTLQTSFGEDGMHVYYGQDVIVSVVVLPVDMSQSTLSFQLKNADGVVDEMDLPGFAFQSGKVYHFYEHSGNPPYGSCPDGNHPHAIDLGLPSGTLWACMDIGADKPTDVGFSWFPWGETALIEKNSSTWENYRFMSSAYSNEWGITRYQIPDNQTDGIWYNGETFVGDNWTRLDLQDDAARVIWGGEWRLPTKEEWKELINYTVQRETGHTYYNGPYSNIYIEYDYNGIPGAYGMMYYKKKVANNAQYSPWDTHLFIRNHILTSEVYYIHYRESWRWTSDLGSSTNKAIAAYTRNGDKTDYLVLQEQDRIRPFLIRPVKSKSGGGAGGGGGTSW